MTWDVGLRDCIENAGALGIEIKGGKVERLLWRW